MNTFRKAALLAAAALVFSAGCASTSTSEGAGEYVDDAVITTKVKAAIFNQPTLKSMDINVETYKGAVQLSGFVKTQTEMSLAVDVARKVAGVKSVRDDMRLK